MPFPPRRRIVLHVLVVLVLLVMPLLLPSSCGRSLLSKADGVDAVFTDLFGQRQIMVMVHVIRREG